MNVHNIDKNLEFSKGKEFLRARIRKFYELVFCGLEDIEQPSYELYGKEREKQGIDTEVYYHDCRYKIQEKIRSHKYWNNRNKDLYIELKNEWRGGDGWFEKYKGNIDFIGYFFTKDIEYNEIYFVLYNKYFFNIIQTCIDTKSVIYPNAHLQTNNNGIDGGKTSGCIVKQEQIKAAEVARYVFYKNAFFRIIK